MSRTIKTLTGALLVLIALTGPQVAAQDVRRSLTSVARMLFGDGSASAPSLAFASLPTLGLYKATNFGFGGVGGGVTSMYLSFGGGGALQQNSAAYVGWTATADAIGGAVDLTLYRDAAGTLAQRNGTNPQTFRLYNTYTDASNYERAFVRYNANVLEIGGEQAGTGSARNMSVLAPLNGTLSLGVGSTTYVQVNSNGFGYKTGVGGAVTQATSRTTGVTLNTVTGDITLFSAAGSATAASFTVTDSAVAATDNIIINEKSGTNLYQTLVTTVGAGSFVVTFFTTGGVAVDAPVFHFSVIKGASS